MRRRHSSTSQGDLDVSILVQGVLTESLRRKARSDWNIDRMAAQYGEGLAQGTTYPLALLPGVSDITATGDGVSYVSTRTVRRTGLPPVFTITVLGSEPEATPSLDVKISYTDGQAELLTFFIVPAAPSTSAAADGQGSAAALQSSSTSAWSPWTFYWTGDGKDGNDQIDQESPYAGYYRHRVVIALSARLRLRRAVARHAYMHPSKWATSFHNGVL
jgi:hypothetical protein